ncbi:DUF1772 domain-containing protein [Sphaerisporangium sp. TRM90804]|uniref:anthrone oxygenase family protein n=1 Tax=Sphaerisporangium sp. TRM90804 TaxID=3031113 RepID=UPI00244BF836|nr:DUF1772 domain-containing protein [Sphaerisporangium sp. TRM90804]MDH2427216.1 DUF1772 domain-containing protein [Sphaerisporangium sp. TRM90804]
MLIESLTVAALLGAGTTAGVLFGVAVSVVPALRDMPPGRYVETHQLLGRHWDPLMPVIVLGTTAVDVALSLLAGDLTSRVLFGLAAALLFASSMVSHLLNVPLNRQVKKLDPALPIPSGWQDPRPAWRRWHTLRTLLALAAFTLTTLATVT